MKKKVFITGSSSGIGEYLAYTYSKLNYFVGLAARREDKLHQVASKCIELGGETKIYTLDVLDEDKCIETINDFINLPGKLDTIYANAGIGSPDQLSSGKPEAMNRILQTNILGVTNTVMPFIPHMKSQKSGKISVISSIASFRGLPHHSAYSGSKAAVRNICQGWGSALKKHGVSVTAVCPGFIKSEMTDSNSFYMPFLMNTDIAANKIIRAVNKKKKVYIFPWQMRLLAIPIMKYAPDWIISKFSL